MKCFYFSGVTEARHVEILEREKAPGLMVNVLRLHPKLANAITNSTIAKVMDSGGFQGNTNFEKYAATIIKFADHFTWFANLDVMNNQEASNRNYDMLLNLLPGEVHYKILWIYQYSQETTVDEVLSHAERYGPKIGIGGLVPYLRHKREHVISKIKTLAEVLQARGYEVHFFGAGCHDVITNMGNNSSDSSKWLIGAKSRALMNNAGKKIIPTQLGLTFSKDECLAQNVRSIVKWLEN